MGKLIVLEGLDGSGKTTQAQRLLDALRERGETVVPISFPAYDNESSALVRLYLGGGLGNDPDGVSPYAASMFYAADRYITYKQSWQTAMNSPDTIVLATRYTTANAYHQLAKLPREEWDAFLDWLFDFEFTKLGLPKPDEVFLLEMPAEASSRQVASRAAKTGETPDIHERDADYLERCREAAVYAAEKLGWHRIMCFENGAVLPREVITARLCAALGF